LKSIVTDLESRSTSTFLTFSSCDSFLLIPCAQKPQTIPFTFTRAPSAKAFRLEQIKIKKIHFFTFTSQMKHQIYEPIPVRAYTAFDQYSAVKQPYQRSQLVLAAQDRIVIVLRD